MKLILLADVKKLGRKGDVVEVADGYATNFLLPRKLAAPATEGVIRARQKEQAEQVAKKDRAREEAQSWAERLQERPLEVAVRAGEGGKLFGSVTTQDVARAIERLLGTSFDKRKVGLPSNIKSLGEHKATVKLYPGVTASVTIQVVPEGSRSHG
ncbi:MAG: 50S ribosomal protein L9 [Armatimonadetes bacterium]|nr:50S ribosomal protein L9 [Armatimonadota bacterium]